VLLVGLTGGIGSGKTTVARLLEARGAVVIDADDLARRAIDPDTPGLARLLDEFGAGVIGEDASVDREALADIVFADPAARRRLEAIIHPEVARLFAEATEPYRDTDRVVVYAVPLLVENHLEHGFDMVVVVAAAEDARVARLRDQRGMAEQDIRGRIAAQASDRDRAQVADVVIDNSGSPEDLERAVNRLWDDLSARAARSRGSAEPERRPGR
jgi:dephospho-CoA kinase